MRADGAAAPNFLPVRWQARFVIVPFASIVRIDACDNHVTIVADRSYPHRSTLAALAARLPGDAFVQVHRSHVVNLAAVRELRARAHGEYLMNLCDGSSLVSGRAFRDAVQRAFGFESA